MTLPVIWTSAARSQVFSLTFITKLYCEFGHVVFQKLKYHMPNIFAIKRIYCFPHCKNCYQLRLNWRYFWERKHEPLWVKWSITWFLEIWNPSLNVGGFYVGKCLIKGCFFSAKNSNHYPFNTIQKSTLPFFGIVPFWWVT